MNELVSSLTIYHTMLINPHTEQLLTIYESNYRWFHVLVKRRHCPGIPALMILDLFSFTLVSILFLYSLPVHTGLVTIDKFSVCTVTLWQSLLPNSQSVCCNASFSWIIHIYCETHFMNDILCS